MSLPPLFSSASPAGIIVEMNGNRVIAPSKRADGSVRKAVQIRAGYTPEEDIAKFRSSRMAESGPTKNLIPGSKPTQVSTIPIAKMSKSQQKREKLKAKLKGEEVEAVSSDEEPSKIVPVAEVRESWESEEEEDAETVLISIPVVVEDPPAAIVDEGKRIKGLQKKLRQVSPSQIAHGHELTMNIHDNRQSSSGIVQTLEQNFSQSNGKRLTAFPISKQRSPSSLLLHSHRKYSSTITSFAKRRSYANVEEMLSRKVSNDWRRKRLPPLLI